MHLVGDNLKPQRSGGPWTPPFSSPPPLNCFEPHKLFTSHQSLLGGSQGSCEDCPRPPSALQYSVLTCGLSPHLLSLPAHLPAALGAESETKGPFLEDSRPLCPAFPSLLAYLVLSPEVRRPGIALQKERKNTFAFSRQPNPREFSKKR